MRNFTENTITEAVLERVSQAPDQRVRDISVALVQYLHDFVREIAPTQAELRYAINFLTRTGQMCSAERQEFILLSDALGVSMLVDTINHGNSNDSTETTVLGPFYVENPSEIEPGGFAATGMAGQKLLVEGSVGTVAGLPLPGATVDTWQSDGEGFYDVQLPGGRGAQQGRGRLRTDSQGHFWFRSIVPSFYPIPNDGPVGDMLAAQGRHPYRPAHVHFMISAPGYATIVTHIFLDGDKYLDSDVVFGVKDALIVRLGYQEAGKTPYGNIVDEGLAVLRYDFVLAPKPVIPDAQKNNAAPPDAPTL